MLASPRWPAALRRVLLLAVAGAATVLLSACSITIQSHEVAQRDVVGDLVVTTKLCDITGNSSGPGGSTPTPGADPCDVGSYDDAPAEVQHFLAYLASDWLVAPKTVGFKGDPGDVQLTRSPQIEAAMQAEHPAPAGLAWVGYESKALPQQKDGVPNRVTATAVFGVPAGELRSEAIVEAANSYRWVSDSDARYDPKRPITCYAGSQPHHTEAETACLYSSSWESVIDPDSGETRDVYATTKLNAVRFAAPQPAAIEQAQVAELEFSAQSLAAPVAAADKAPVLELSAVTSVPGATLEWPSTLALGGEQAVPVKVAVPASTPAGEYTVTLGDVKGVRSATAKLAVTAAPAPLTHAQPVPPPVVATDLIQTSRWLADELDIDPAIRGSLRRGRAFTARPNLPNGGFLRISLVQRPKKAADVKRPPVLFVGTGPTDKPGPKAIGVKPTKQGGPLLRKAKSFNGYIVLRFWDRSGKTVSTPVKLKLK